MAPAEAPYQINRIDTPAGGSLGVTAAPFIRSGTAAVVDLARRADRLGYDSFWVAEVTGIEALALPCPGQARGTDGPLVRDLTLRPLTGSDLPASPRCGNGAPQPPAWPASTLPCEISPPPT
jgi:hypothetical protein